MLKSILKANQLKIFTLLLVAVVVFGAVSLPMNAYADEGGTASASSDSSTGDSGAGDSGSSEGGESADSGSSGETAGGDSAGGSSDEGNTGDTTSTSGTQEEEGDTVSDTGDSLSDTDSETGNADTDTESGAEEETGDNSGEGDGSVPPEVGGGDIGGVETEPNIHPEVDPVDTGTTTEPTLPEDTDTGTTTEPTLPGDGDTGTTTATTTEPTVGGGTTGEEEPNIHPALLEDEVVAYQPPVEDVSAEYDFLTLGEEVLPLVDEDTSAEYSFTTLSDTALPLQEEASAEYDFNTLADGGQPPLEEEHSVEYSFTTPGDNPPPPPVEEEVSTEYNFITLSDNNPPITEEVSTEYNFTTLSDSQPPVDEEVSREYFFRTLSDTNPPVDEEVSREYEFTTPDDGCTNCEVDEEISREYDFTTPDDGCTNCEVDEEVSREYEFTTPDDGCTNCEVDEEISREYDFTTPDDGCTNCEVDEEVSREYEFTTKGDDDCTENCGGGGGGGGGGKKKDKVLPSPCVPLLLKFIRLGANNDPYEVYKLQWFLRTFEGLEVPLNGVYDLQTYEAVKVFQGRHAEDVLHTWGITEPTGYVYITTLLMVNYIYCDIDEPIRLELENKETVGYTYYGGTRLPSKGDGLQYLDYPAKDVRAVFDGISLDLPNEVEKEKGNIFQLAAAGFMDWVGGVGGKGWWWLVILPFVLLAAYLYHRLKEEQTEKELSQDAQDIILEAEQEINAEPIVGAGADTPLKDGVPDEVVAEYNAANGGHQAGQEAIVMPGESLEDRES